MKPLKTILKTIQFALFSAASLLSAAGIVFAEPFRMGILQVIDTLPLQVGVTEGYFAAENIDMELVPFTSAM